MENNRLTAELLSDFARHLRAEERSPGTIEKYLRDAAAFARWLDGRPVSRDAAAAWKARLQDAGYAPASINSMLNALNGLLRFLGREDCRVKLLKIQRRLFRDSSRELTRAEYLRLLETARAEGRSRLSLLMETICATGIRVSELRYITVEAVERGRAEVRLKGKIRVILIPGKLRRKLLRYAGKNKTASGEVFLTRNGNPLSRKQIWAEMKAICEKAGIAPSKVFPHNLRHLFATMFYKACRDIARLSDVLGHSSIETTRIYLMSTGSEHSAVLESLHLIS